MQVNAVDLTDNAEAKGFRGLAAASDSTSNLCYCNAPLLHKYKRWGYRYLDTMILLLC